MQFNFNLAVGNICLYVCRAVARLQIREGICPPCLTLATALPCGRKIKTVEENGCVLKTETCGRNLKSSLITIQLCFHRNFSLASMILLKALPFSHEI